MSDRLESPAEDSAWRKVQDALEALRIPHKAMPCDPAFADTAAFCERYGIPAEESVNTILIASRQEPKRWAVCLVLSTCRVDVNHAVRDLLGVKRLSFASEEETRERTGMMIGGVAPFGLPADLPIYVDARVMDAQQVVVGGGSRSWKVRLAPSGLNAIPNLSVVPGLGNPREK